MKKIYLIDVSSMFFRAFYAIRPLTSPTGTPVNAVYGFLSMLSKLMKEEKPDYMVFCYDRKEASFRKELYDGYKANRSEMPEDLALQIPYIKKIAVLLGIPSVEVDTFEADDLIGTLTKFARRKNLDVVIVSGDKDFAQLIEDHVIIYDTMKDVRYDAQKALEKWGVGTAQFIDYLAIVGDTSDNVPGVKGIGEKGAVKLLQQFKDLEDIYENIDLVESKSIKQKLLDAKEMAFLSKKLVTIVTDVKVSENLEDYHMLPFRVDELRALLQELNFKTFERTLLGENGLHTQVPDPNRPSAPVEERPLIRKVSPSAQNLSFAQAEVPQTEVTLFAVPADWTEITMDLQSLKSWLRPQDSVWGIRHEEALYLRRENEVVIFAGDLKSLGGLTDHLQIRWSGYDLKGFWHAIEAKTPRIFWDSQLAAYIIKAGDTADFRKILMREAGEMLPDFVSASQVLALHLHLQIVLAEKMKVRQVEKVFHDFDLPLPEILLLMENKGVRIDRDLLAIQSESLATEIAELEKQIHDLAGGSFNVASPKQLGQILFEKLSLQAGKKNKTGYSTDTDVLEKLDHPIAKLVLQFRELSKLKSTYVDALPQLIGADGRVHTSFNQALTATGRLSSTQPNLQNIPIRTERGQQVRRAFIADQGMKLLSLDYSQIELRILAHISEDPNLCKAFEDDLDIHTATAAEIFNVSLKDVTSNLRRTAKAVNFGIAYGQGAFGLAEVLGIPRGEAQDIIKRYFERFKNVRGYIESTTTFAHENGYVETLFGRRRYIDELSSKNAAMKKFGERAAINAPIQGTASDLVKKAMIDIHREIPLPLVLQVHDELIFEASESDLQKHTPRLVTLMEGVAKLRVPLKVNYAIGRNWDEAH